MRVVRREVSLEGGSSGAFVIHRLSSVVSFTNTYLCMRICKGREKEKERGEGGKDENKYLKTVFSETLVAMQ